MSELVFKDSLGKHLKGRLWLAAVVVLVAMGILLLRLWQLQMVQGESYEEMSLKNRMRIIRLEPPRGRILDVHGRILADNRPSFAFSIVPGAIRNPEKIVASYANVIGLTPEIMRSLMISSREYPRFMPFPVKKNMTLEQVSLVKAKSPEPRGVIVQTKSLRIYPYEESLCHVIGTLGEISPKELIKRERQGYLPGDLVGKSGIEQTFENYLKGVDGWEKVEIDARGKQLGRRDRVEPTRGTDIVLTVDIALQRFVEEVFIYRAGSVVAVEPDTGRILAMVSKPSFSLNLFTPSISRTQWESLRTDPLHPLENRAIRGLYSPASTFKLVTAAAALAENAIDPQEKLTCTGSMELGGQTFRCWNQHGHGKVDLKRAIAESCDIYFYHVGLRLGPGRLAHYGSLFGFGKPTGIELPHELPGLVPTSQWKLRTYGEGWVDGETLTVAIGQGYLVCTPTQLAMATAVLANGGRLLKPAIIKQIRSSDGKVVYDHTPVERWKVPLSGANFSLLRQALRAVVSDKKGTGRRARVPDIKVSGKTGTSQVMRLRQKPEADELVPYHERTHSIFVAYVDNMPKKIALAVIIEHGGSGGKSAARLARSVICRYYGVPDPGDPKK